MIPLHKAMVMLHTDEETIRKLVEEQGVTLFKLHDIEFVDEVKLTRLFGMDLALGEYDRYKAEQVRIRKKEIDELLLQLDDLAYLYKSVKRISPILRFIMKETASLLPEGLRRNIFIDVATGLKITDVAQKYKLHLAKACHLYESAVRHIQKNQGFIMEYHEALTEKELENKALSLENRNLKSEIQRLKGILGELNYEEIAAKGYLDQTIPFTVIQTLFMRMDKDFDLDTRTVNCLMLAYIRTVEDLLRFIKQNGFKALLNIRSMGNKSVNNLEEALIRHNIIDKNGQSDLFQYLH